MTPDQISALAAIAAILTQVGTWPISTVLVIITIGPWVANVWITRTQAKLREKERAEALVAKAENEKRQEIVREEHEKQFQSVKQMYENNVDLVKVSQKNAEALLECVVANTMKWAGVEEKIDQNQWCPLARIRMRTEEMHP